MTSYPCVIAMKVMKMLYGVQQRVCKSYQPAFDAMTQLKELGCPIFAISATLTDVYIQILKQDYLQSTANCIVLTCGVTIK